MKPLRFHWAAEQELLESAFFYEDQSFGLGKRWQAEVEAVLRKIRSQPGAGRPAGRMARQVVLPSFPYAVIFLNRVEEIYIVAIAHQSRNPGYWAKRLNPGAS